MKERPILFSAPMVRALLAGTKTQTRRLVKPADAALLNTAFFYADCERFRDLDHEPAQYVGLTCPYGAPGDRLWVRETFMYREKHDRYYYRADHPVQDPYAHNGWKPSIHMPRKASRITLEVTGVRVERLQAITDADAKAEGVQPFECVAPEQVIPGPGFDGARLGDQPHRLPFADLWRSINGPESWDENPWVWVVVFKRVRS